MLSLNISPNRPDTVYRNLKLPQGPLQIAEQAGETIIRHVWDAGIILSAAFTCDPISMLPDNLQHFISPLLSKRAMKVLELGTGVGILGISMSAAFQNMSVVMTDLLDAKPLVEENIRLNTSYYSHLARNASFRALDWEERPFPEWTMMEPFDLIVMADVTYNTATFVALSETLEHLLRSGSKGGKVVCCGKRRHDEEEGFWKLISERGFVIHNRVIYATDLEGTLRFCGDSRKEEGEQLIDFISVSLT